jgi:glyoxylase-like metal-dependent hydrolase (beta-lactamase superfamily II)
LAEGVYAAIAMDEGSAIGNAGIIDLGDQTIVFDTFMTPTAAQDLRAAAESLTGNSIAYAINSHWHNDHIRGNQVFAPTTQIVSTTRTRELIATKGIEELEYDKASAESDLRSVRDSLKKDTDELRLRDARSYVAYFEGMIESFPNLELRLANLTFKRRLIFHGSRREAAVICFSGHTEDDSILVLPTARIVFMADLLFSGYHPYLLDGNPWEWTQALNEIGGLDVQVAVPGHGPVGGASDLLLVERYILELEKLAADVVNRGGSVDDAAACPIPEPFGNWRFAGFFPQNMRFLYNVLSNKAYSGS